MKHFPLFLSSDNRILNNEKGFTLIEVLVVATIIVFLSVTLILNFSRTKIDIEQSVNLVVSTIREAQSRAVSSVTYNGYNPCGYGIHYVSPSQIMIYAGPNASTSNCSTINKNYGVGEDAPFRTETLRNATIQFTGSFNDIFFLPPDPKTYLDNVAFSATPINIIIGPVGGTCPQDCKTISVYSSGRIDTQ